MTYRWSSHTFVHTLMGSCSVVRALKIPRCRQSTALPAPCLAMACPVVLLVGAAGVGKSVLRSRLLPSPSSAAPQQQQDKQAQQQQEQHPSQPDDAATHWDIDTKYYSVRVAVSEIHLPGPSQEAAAVAAQPQVAEIEALVLVVDSRQESSFQAARAWAESSPALMDAEIRLLLANKTDLLLPPSSQQPSSSHEPERPQWLLAAMDWCAGSGFEYIEVCGTDAQLDAQLLLDGEEQGLSRVLHALQAHMWPGMQLKDRQEAAAADCGSAGPAGAAAGGQQQPPAGGRCPAWEQEADSVALTTQPAGAGRDTSREKGKAAAGPAAPSSHAHDNGVDEQELESFEKIFTEIQGAKTRLAGLPDQERRSQAAAIAMRLASMLGLDSDEEDEGEEEDEEEEGARS